jgi:hypothetical protein
MVQGGVLLMDTPADYGLTVLLLLTTVTPRLLWLYLWARGGNGADLMVWHKPAF